jgi:chromosome segregation ATPase
VACILPVLVPAGRTDGRNPRLKEESLMGRIRYIIPLFFLLFAFPAAAQFYKYVDENGNVHFTDDYNQVPEDQRENIKEYKEYQSQADDQQTTLQANPEGKDAEKQEETDSADNLDYVKKIEELDQRKTALDAEYAELMQENNRLNEMRKTVKTKADAEKYNESVRNLNQQFEEHDRKRRDLLNDVEAYNARVAEANEKKTTKQKP